MGGYGSKEEASSPEEEEGAYDHEKEEEREDRDEEEREDTEEEEFCCEQTTENQNIPNIRTLVTIWLYDIMLLYDML